MHKCLHPQTMQVAGGHNIGHLLHSPPYSCIAYGCSPQSYKYIYALGSSILSMSVAISKFKISSSSIFHSMRSIWFLSRSISMFFSFIVSIAFYVLFAVFSSRNMYCYLCPFVCYSHLAVPFLFESVYLAFSSYTLFSSSCQFSFVLIFFYCT